MSNTYSMTPRSILTAVRLGQSVLRAEHKALDILWGKFGQAVRRERKSRGISPTVFASRLGVTPTMLSYMERGKRAWGMKRAEKVVSLLVRPEQWPDAGRLP